MVFFRHEASLAVYNAFTGFDRALITTGVKTTTLDFARLDDWIVSSMDLLREKESHGDRHQKDYSKTLGKFFHSAATELVKGVRPIAKY